MANSENLTSRKIEISRAHVLGQLYMHLCSTSQKCRRIISTKWDIVATLWDEADDKQAKNFTLKCDNVRILFHYVIAREWSFLIPKGNGCIQIFLIKTLLAIIISQVSSLNWNVVSLHKEIVFLSFNDLILHRFLNSLAPHGFGIDCTRSNFWSIFLNIKTQKKLE